MLTAQRVIEELDLRPLPVEGGFYRETFRSREAIPALALPARYGGERAIGSAIYYLLTSDADSFSALHRLPTDEVYHYYLGDPVEMTLLHPDGRGTTIILGSDLLAGQCVQLVVPRDVWQGAKLRAGGRFALLGTTMAPGFDSTDYTGGDRDELIRRYPEEAERIRALTRADPAPGKAVQST